MNQWAAKVTGKTTSAYASEQAPARAHYQQFMYNPAKYGVEEISRLRSFCEAPVMRYSETRLRKGIEDE
ncbi:uncharacterized protein CCR75_009046 [Bremia lactucae]|uniref:Uncharacterized protein n=1 Tax=Bremia lactucae TaxID=4779 RepID=A0A976IAX3_BRELC|nr:hypothetical protein CCR75_009046 [Bremia lactucae]